MFQPGLPCQRPEEHLLTHAGHDNHANHDDHTDHPEYGGRLVQPLEPGGYPYVLPPLAHDAHSAHSAHSANDTVSNKPKYKTVVIIERVD